MATLLSEMIRKSEAEAAGITTDKKFINFLFMGGISRWLMDLPLKANAGDPFVVNPMLGSSFDNSLNLVYQTTTHTNFNGIRMPFNWSGNIPTVGGGAVPMANLAPNMLMAMGVDFQIDSHETDRTRQLLPVAGRPSLNGVVADHALTPIPSITYLGYYDFAGYASEKGIANLDMRSSTNPIGDALSPFTGASTIKEISNAQARTAINNLFGVMKTQSGLLHQRLPSSYDQRLNAQSLMLESFGNLQQIFDTLKAKYEGLISRSFTDPSLFLSGVETIALPGSASLPRWEFYVDSSGNKLRYSGTNFNNAFTATSSITNLASGMAVVEYMLMNGYTSAANVLVGDIQGLLLDQVTKYEAGGTLNSYSRDVSLDMHFMGSVPQMIMLTRYTRAFYACLYELIQQFKTKTAPGGAGTLWDQTLVQLSSEFNRMPKTDQSGSEHGPVGSNMSWFSGMISACDVVGNIKTSTNAGSWGTSAPVPEFNNLGFRIPNLASTVAAALDLPSPTPADAPVAVKNAQGKLVRAPGLLRGKHV